jgi:hypothetical protein
VISRSPSGIGFNEKTEREIPPDFLYISLLGKQGGSFFEEQGMGIAGFVLGIVSILGTIAEVIVGARFGTWPEVSRYYIWGFAVVGVIVSAVSRSIAAAGLTLGSIGTIVSFVGIVNRWGFS